MPRFKLTLEDASGKTKSATIEAASQAEAVDLARRKGYQVKQIEPMYDLDDAPPAPPDTAEEPYPDDRRSSLRGGGRGGRPGLLFLILPTALAGLALLVAVGTLIYVLASDPLGSGLGKYKFDSPRDAYKSRLEMEVNADVRAQIQYDRKFRERTPRGKEAKAELDSYRVRKEVEWGSKKGLFITTKGRRGEEHRVVWYEKDEKSGYWVETEVNMEALAKDKPKLAEQIANFQQSGEVPE